jgi:hypothetical protein
MLFALTLGSKFSVLAQWKPSIVRYRKALQELGLVGQCASVRSFDVEPSFDTLMGGKKDDVSPVMVETCMQCIEQRRSRCHHHWFHYDASGGPMVGRAVAGTGDQSWTAHLQAGGSDAGAQVDAQSDVLSQAVGAAVGHAARHARCSQKIDRGLSERPCKRAQKSSASGALISAQ